MSDKLCACGHVENFHAPGLGCSGSHSDSMPCTHYAPPWRGADLDVLRPFFEAAVRTYGAARVPLMRSAVEKYYLGVSPRGGNRD